MSIDGVEHKSPWRRSWAAIVGIALIALVAFGVIGLRSYREQRAATGALSRATRLVEKADETVVDIDKVIQAQIEPALAKRAQEAAADVDRATDSLQEADGLIGRAIPDLRGDDLERARLLRKACRARLTMLEGAPAILAANEDAARAISAAMEAWKTVLTIDTSTDEAIAAYNKHDKAGVTRSSTINSKVASDLVVAREGFATAEKEFAAAEFERYLAYLDVLAAGNKLSRQADAAWLAGNLELANTASTAFNNSDAQAIALAKQLPASPEKMVADAFERTAKAAMDAYYDARDAALAADDRLRKR